jgi:hypothetical protein
MNHLAGRKTREQRKEKLPLVCDLLDLPVCGWDGWVTVIVHLTATVRTETPTIYREE